MNREYEILLGQRIKAIRDSCKMTQEEVAARLQLLGCDITRSALAKIEVGQRHIYPFEIYALKNVLDVKYDELFPEPQNWLFDPRKYDIPLSYRP